MEVEKLEESKQILIAVTELQANMRNMSAKIEEISKISTLILETDQRAKSAHNRIDDLKTEFADKLQAQKQDYEEKIAVQEKSLDKLESNITWLWRSVGGGGITLIFGLILFYLTRGGN
jgi:uncharacterized protein (DUF3084 family)